MIRIAICDDEAAEAGRIEGFVRAYDDFDVSVYTSSRELAWAITDGAVFDLYLLDVVMPKPDGIELARLIRETDETATILYLTNHDGHALDAYRVRASQYLTKPVDRETLHRELDAALSVLRARNAKVFPLRTKDGTQAIHFHRIVYCEHEGRAICCVTADGEKRRSVSLRKSFDEAVSALLVDERFIRPHTSFVVNLDYVKGIEGHSLILKTGGELSITHRALSGIKEKYLRHFFRGERE